MISRFMNKAGRITVVIIFVLFFSLSGFSQDGNNATLVDKIIAKVDNYIVLRSDLERAYLNMLSRGESPGTDLQCRVLESLIINKLLVAKADIDSVIVTDEEVGMSLDRKMNYFISQAGSQQKLEEFYGKTIEEFKEELMDQEREELLIQRMEQKITSNIKITPAEVREFFNNIPADSLPFYSKQATVGQIVKIPKPGKTQKDQVKSALLSLKSRIEAGESFSELAAEYSQEPAAKQSGGNIGFRKRGELAPEYEAAALRLDAGEISHPVETDFGIHIIQLLERRGNEFNTRHILMEPDPSAEDFVKARRELDSIRSLILNDSISFEKAAKEFSDHQATAVNGGYFLDNTGTNKMLMEELNPSVYFTIDTMEVGNISRPINYTMEDGTNALRIVYYKQSYQPHRANLKDDWLRIQQAALNQKKARSVDKWFDQARYEVFIDIDNNYGHCQILN